jgi:hypothetical protein
MDDFFDFKMMLGIIWININRLREDAMMRGKSMAIAVT